MKKKLLKQIRQVANELPEMTYTAVTQYNRVNHYRRLKRLVEKVGFDEGVKKYLRAIKVDAK